MDMIPVASSNIDSIGYDEDTEKLRVRFNDGGTYEYQDVPGNVFTGLRDAASVGSYFHNRIKNVYTSTKL